MNEVRGVFAAGRTGSVLEMPVTGASAQKVAASGPLPGIGPLPEPAAGGAQP